MTQVGLIQRLAHQLVHTLFGAGLPLMVVVVVLGGRGDFDSLFAMRQNFLTIN